MKSTLPRPAGEVAQAVELTGPTTDRLLSAVRSRRADWAHALAPILLLLLWFVFLGDIDLRSMTDLGLVSVLPRSILFLLGLLTVSFVLSLRRETPTVVRLVHVVVLAVMLFGVTAVTEADPRFASTWRHVGIIDHLSRYGSVDTSIDAYFSWPGFFSLGALANETAGWANSLSIAAWGPLFFNLLYLAPLVTIFRWASDDERVVWLGIWTFYALNWIGQDYFSPQAVGFFLWVSMLAILLTRFTPHAEVSGGRLSLRAVGGQVVQSVRGVFRPDPVGERSPATSRQIVGLAITVAVIDAAIVSGHQLTPMPALLTVTGLVLLAGLATRRLPIVMLVLLAAWISYMTTGFLEGHIETLTKPVGDVSANLNQNVSGRIAGSEDHQFVVHLRVAMTLGVWALAGVGVVRRLLAHRFDIAMLVAGAAPLVLPFVQPYGGEVLLRVYLFVLPAASFFIACTAFPTPSTSSSRRVLAAVAVVSCIALGLFQITRYGNERQDYFTPGDVAAVDALYELAPVGATIWAGDDNLPLKAQSYADYNYAAVSELPTWKSESPDPAAILAEVRTASAGEDAYVIITRSTRVSGELFEGRPGTLEALTQLLDSAPGVSHLYHNPDGDVYLVPAAP